MTGQSVTFAFRPRERSALVALWRRVLLNAETAPACPCHGIVAGRLDPDAIEANMLAPLRTRYREEGLRDLRDFIERRLRKSPFAGLRQPFEGWLEAIATAGLAPQDRARLERDLGEALAWHAEQQFECG